MSTVERLVEGSDRLLTINLTDPELFRDGFPSANRDERVFTDPFRFDIRRRPNPHVSFGAGGPHYCLGANLAKLEVRTVFDQLLTRFPDMAMTGPMEWGAATPDQNGAASVTRVPVRLHG